MKHTRTDDDVRKFISKSKWICESTDIMDLDINDFEKNSNNLWESYLLELFDIKTGPEYTIKQSGYNYFGTFSIFEENYRVEISPSEKSGFYYVNFKILNPPNAPKPEDFSDIRDFGDALHISQMKMTNRNHPILVFSFVASFVHDFIVKYKPLGIVFSDIDNGKRKSVYSELANKLAQKTGYVVIPHKDPNIYIVAKKDNQYDNSR